MIDILLVSSLVIGTIPVIISFYFCYKIVRLLKGWRNMIGILIALISLSLAFRISGFVIQFYPDEAIMAALYKYVVPPAYSIVMLFFTYKLYRTIKNLFGPR